MIVVGVCAAMRAYIRDIVYFFFGIQHLQPGTGKSEKKDPAQFTKQAEQTTHKQTHDVNSERTRSRRPLLSPPFPQVSMLSCVWLVLLVFAV